MSPDGAILTVYIVYALGLLLTLGAVLTWVERKQAAIMADRIGANRAYIRIPFTNVKLIWWGLFHGMADGLKLLLKEDWRPRAYDSLAYALGPWLAFIPVLVVFAVIPFGGQLDPGALFPGLADWFGGRTYPMQIAPLDAGLLVVFAFGGISIIGAMLATADAVAALLPRDHPIRLLDLGSGTGSLLRPLARQRPDCRCEGVESAPAPYLLSRILARHQHNIALARGDFFKMPWGDYDLVYAFLSPVPMSAVWNKARAELRPGALLVSNSFPVEGVDPEEVIEVPLVFGTRFDAVRVRCCKSRPA